MSARGHILIAESIAFCDNRRPMDRDATLAAYPRQESSEQRHARIFRAHARYVFAIAQRILFDRDDAEDVVQDVFAAAVNQAPSASTDAELRGWLATVTVRKARRRLRRGKLFRLFERGDEQALQVSGLSPEAALQLRALQRTLQRLQPDARIVWALRHIEGEKLEAIAAMTELSLATVKRRLSEAQLVIDATFEEQR